MSDPPIRPGLPRWARVRTAPVRMRVTMAATVVALVLGVLGAWGFYASLHRDLESALVDAARQQARTIAAQLESGSAPAQVVITTRDDVVTQVVDQRGSIIGSDHPELTGPLLVTPGAATGRQIPGHDDRYAVVALRAATGELVLVARSEEQVAQASRTAALLLALSVPLAVALLASAVWLAVGRALRPVERMRREAERIGTAHEERRLPQPPGADEITRLATTLNEMLDRIEGSQRAQRQFVSDASHELRSPLAVIRQMAEVARRHPEGTDLTQLTGGILAEERRMEGLVSALLTLARLDDGVSGSRQEVVDLDDVVLDEVKRARQVGGPGIDATAVGAGQVRGDPVLVTQLVRNLLDNAARHARSHVLVTLSEDAGWVRLVVGDDGAGVPAEEREHIFGRFVRLDEARTRDTGGSGLGLAIVAKVVAAAGGSIVVGETPEGGACFTVALPAA